MIEVDESAEIRRTMGRLGTDKCLMCGDTLLLDGNGQYNEYHCCSECTKNIERERKKVLNEVDMGRKAHKIPHRRNLAFREKCNIITHMGET